MLCYLNKILPVVLYVTLLSRMSSDCGRLQPPRQWLQDVHDCAAVTAQPQVQRVSLPVPHNAMHVHRFRHAALRSGEIRLPVGSCRMCTSAQRSLRSPKYSAFLCLSHTTQCMRLASDTQL
jgi:hypothetical protein